MLLRKVWNKLEKVCKQEGVQRYQIEARTMVTPGRARPPTELEKAREKVKEILEEEKKTKRNTLKKAEEERKQIEKE